MGAPLTMRDQVKTNVLYVNLARRAGFIFVASFTFVCKADSKGIGKSVDGGLGFIITPLRTKEWNWNGLEDNREGVTVVLCASWACLEDTTLVHGTCFGIEVYCFVVSQPVCCVPRFLTDIGVP